MFLMIPVLQKTKGKEREKKKRMMMEMIMLRWREKRQIASLVSSGEGTLVIVGKVEYCVNEEIVGVKTKEEEIKEWHH